MVNYKCFRCGYETHIKTILIRHLSRKNSCEPKLYDIDIKTEQRRLINKLNSGLINSIWFQFGSDLQKLKKEIYFIKNIQTNLSDINSNSIDIFGSIFIPSKQFLARFKFRPWRGVFLSNEYLNSIEESKIITKNILNLYSDNDIVPLIESECINQKQLIEARKFIMI